MAQSSNGLVSEEINGVPILGTLYDGTLYDSILYKADSEAAGVALELKRLFHSSFEPPFGLQGAARLRGSEGGTRHLAGMRASFTEKLGMVVLVGLLTLTCGLDQRHVVQLAWWINVLLNWDIGGEGGIAHLNLCEVVQLAIWINLLLKAARGVEGYSQMLNKKLPLNNMSTWPGNYPSGSAQSGISCAGNYPPRFAPAGTSWPQIRAPESHIGAFGGGGRLEQAICKDGIPHMAGKQIKSTRGGEVVTANNNRDAESHNIDIKDEEPPQSTDFVIQKPNNASHATRMQAIGTSRRHNRISLLHRALAPQRRRTIYINGGELQGPKIKILQWSTPMTLVIFTIAAATTESLPKHLLRIELVLIAMSFACLVFRAIFHEKLSSKSLNVAANLAFACNVFAFFLLVGICFAQI